MSFSTPTTAQDFYNRSYVQFLPIFQSDETLPETISLLLAVKASTERVHPAQREAKLALINLVHRNLSHVWTYWKRAYLGRKRRTTRYILTVQIREVMRVSFGFHLYQKENPKTGDTFLMLFKTGVACRCCKTRAEMCSWYWTSKTQDAFFNQLYVSTDAIIGSSIFTLPSVFIEPVKNRTMQTVKP